MDAGVDSLHKIIHVMTNWKPRREVWFHLYGAYALSGFTSITALYITAHFRHFLRLDRYARMVMYSVSVAFPGIAAGTFNQLYSNLQIPLRGEKCTSCIAVKASIFQSCMSVMYPSLFTCLLGFYYAHVYHTIPAVPPNFLYDKEQAQYVWRLVQTVAERSHFSKIMMFLFLVNMFAGYYVSEKQQEECLMVYKRVLDKQEMIVRANRGAAVVDSYASGSSMKPSK